MKKAILILAVLLSCCLPIRALSLGSESTTGPVVIIQAGETDKVVIVLEENGELNVSQLPMGGTVYPYLDSNGQPQLLEMQWNLEDESLSHPGLHEITGTPVLADGMALAEGFDGTVTWPVFRKGGAALEIASTPLAAIERPLLGQHANLQEALPLTSAVSVCYLAEGAQLYTEYDPEFYWQWDLSQVDTAVLGSYPVTATLCHPDWVSFPAEYQTVTQTVYVLPTDRIEIYAPLRTSSNGSLEFSWVYDSTNVTAPVLERKNAEGQWEACDESWYTFQSGVHNLYDYLYLRLLSMPVETPLVLRLRYQDVVDGEAVERITEPITLTVPADIAEQIAAANGRVVVDVFGGDRDGGDSGGEDLPDYEQPAPDWYIPVWKPEEEKAPVMEIVTDTYTALSGTRLDQLIQLSATVLFEKQGAAVEIPAPLLDDLDLAADQLLEVTILRPADNAVSLEILADGQAVTDLTGTVVRIPWETADAALQVLDLSGAVIGTAVYEPTGTACFTVDRPGTYWIQAVPAAPEVPIPEEPENTPAPPGNPPEPPGNAPGSSESAPEPVAPAEPPLPSEPEAEELPGTEAEELPGTEAPPAQPIPEEAPEIAPEAEPAPAVQPAPEKPKAAPLWPWLLGLLLLAVLGAYGWKRWRRG